jgi:hypothetical protein
MSSIEFGGIDCDKHIEQMRDWFYQHFEHPHDSVPYDSEEKDFIYIWGGPCYARDELEREFGDVPEECIQALVDELEHESDKWSPIPTLEQLQVETISFDDFEQALYNIKRLLDINLEVELSEYMTRMLFANVITVLETYFEDAFIRYLDDEHLRLFVKTNPKFQKEKFTLSEVFDVFGNIKNDVTTYLRHEVIWHRVDVVKLMYKSTFRIDFPEHLTDVIHKAVPKRHDIVHRNGKNTDWKEISISKKEVEELIVTVEELASYIDRNLPVK